VQAKGSCDDNTTESGVFARTTQYQQSQQAACQRKPLPAAARCLNTSKLVDTHLWLPACVIFRVLSSGSSLAAELGPKLKCWSTTRTLKLLNATSSVGTNPVTARTSCCRSRPPTCNDVSCWQLSVAAKMGLSRQTLCSTSSCRCCRQLHAQLSSAGGPAGCSPALAVCAGTTSEPVGSAWLLPPAGLCAGIALSTLQ
jgi:hypothetical protein